MPQCSKCKNMAYVYSRRLGLTKQYCKLLETEANNNAFCVHFIEVDEK